MVCNIHSLSHKRCMCCTGIELSVKPSLMDSAEVQRVSLLVDGDKMTAGAVEVISTLKIKQVLIHIYPHTQCVEGLVVLQCANGAGLLSYLLCMMLSTVSLLSIPCYQEAVEYDLPKEEKKVSVYICT